MSSNTTRTTTSIGSSTSSPVDRIALSGGLKSLCSAFLVGCSITLITVSFPAGPAFAQEADLGSAAERIDTRSPTGALWRAFALPGWGQVYNKQYAKLPFVYAAIGGLVYMAIQIDGKYNDYRQAYLYKAYQERVDSGIDDVNPWVRYKSSYDAIASDFGQISSTPIRTQRDASRRNRDLSILASGLAYALAVLDAYVSAHLLDFDVGESLSLDFNPVPDGVSIRARISIP